MISIVIPLYNKGTSIKRTLESVLAQTFEQYEIIVVDDGSTDNSSLVVTSLGAENIRLIQQENQGVSCARNRGINEARFHYIALLDADDEWKPDFLQRLVTLIKKYPECSVFASAYDLRFPDGRINTIKLNKLPFRGEEGILSNYFMVAACSHPPICATTIIATKEAFLLTGGFPQGIRSGEDLLTWARLAAKYNIAYCQVPLATFNKPLWLTDRVSRFEKSEKVHSELLKLKRQLKEDQLSDFKKYIGRWNEMRTSILLEKGAGIQAFVTAVRALKYKGFTLKIIIFIFLSLMPAQIQSSFIRQRRKLLTR